MTELSTDLILTNRITDIYNNLYNTTSKLHKRASSIASIEKLYISKQHQGLPKSMATLLIKKIKLKQKES